MPGDVVSAASELEEQMRALGTRERAEGSKRYLKSDLEFFGVTVGGIRRVVKQHLDERSAVSRNDLVKLVDELWRVPIFERRLASVLLLDIKADLLSPRDLPRIERMVRESKTWALVDPLAGDVAGPIVLRHPEAVSTLERWAADDDFWVRRSALLALLRPLRRGADFEPFARFANEMLGEKEFFIRKAIGWVLRETAKKRPDEVYEWLAPRTHLVSGVTIREAVKYLDPKRKARLLEAYKSRCPAV